MRIFTGWAVAAGFILAMTTANAQVLAPEVLAPEVLAPEVSVPQVVVPQVSVPQVVVPQVSVPQVSVPQVSVPQVSASREAPRNGPILLPAPEVYSILRHSGFSPLGTPQRRGFLYTIAVIDRGGDDGRLIIDARDGQIIRFIPAYRIGDNFGKDGPTTYGRSAPLPPVGSVGSVPRPPASVPKLASRPPSVPLPKMPPHAREGEPLAADPTPKSASGLPQQSAAVQAKPAGAPTTPQVALPPAVGEACRAAD
jgi:hypothetical protein